MRAGAQPNSVLGGDANIGNGPGMRREGGAVCQSPLPPSCAPITIELPAPPSVNHLFKNRRNGGRSETEAYRDWKAQVAWRFHHAFGNQDRRPVLFKENVIVLIGVERSNGRADIDNLTKALLDALVRHRVIVDDSRVLGVATAWNPPGKRLARVSVVAAQNLTIEFHHAHIGAFGGWYFSAPSPEGDAEHGD